MLEWLESHGHWGFINLSYGLVLLAIVIDVLSQRSRRSHLARTLRDQRLRRRLRNKG